MILTGEMLGQSPRCSERGRIRELENSKGVHMSVRNAILTLAVVGLVAGSSVADDSKKKDGERGKSRGAEMRKKLLEKFDADGDGKLNEKERAKAHAAMKKHRGERKPGEGRTGGRDGDFRKKMIAKFDADGDGKLNEDERAKAKDEIKKHMEATRAERMKRFDTDGDGKLSDEEKTKARAEFQKRRGDRKPGDSRKPGRSQDFRKKLLEKFDADGDGKLSDDEKAKARAERAKRAQGDKKKRGDGERREKKKRDKKEEA